VGSFTVEKYGGVHTWGSEPVRLRNSWGAWPRESGDPIEPARESAASKVIAAVRRIVRRVGERVRRVVRAVRAASERAAERGGPVGRYAGLEVYEDGSVEPGEVRLEHVHSYAGEYPGVCRCGAENGDPSP
jgi:hypothetical protein